MKKVLLFFALALCTLNSMGQTRTFEGWESRTFDSYRWERPGAYRWEVTSVGAYSGRYCARSGNYYLNSTESALQLAVVVTEGGTLSYMRKVSSEAGYDYFRFYIDGTLMEELSGEAQWDTFSCTVAAGFHRLKWVYSKDGSTSKGSDCVWIDDISWPGAYCDDVVTDSCPAPMGLMATALDGSVSLEWEGGYRTADTVIFDDIEGHPYGAINSAGSVGWHYIDGDSAATSTVSAISFLHEGDTMAFVVLDDDMMTGSNVVAAHSGHRYLASVYHSSINNDDWIVSPELHFADTFAFAFYARGYNTTYSDERFLVCYSTTGSRAEDFIPLHYDTLTTTAAWEQYRFTVPPTARYVAIHHVSYNEYIFCLDDLRISGRIAEGNISNLYRDGTLIAEGLTESRYLDTTAEQGRHCYEVTHRCGEAMESDPSAMACITLGDSLLTKKSGEELLPPKMPSDAAPDGPQNAIDSSHMAYSLAEMEDWRHYPTYGVYVEMMHHFAQEFPQWCRLETILDSTPHPTSPHAILALHISTTPDEATTKPAFLYSSTMHGDEVTGYYLMLRLIDYILHHAESDTAVQEILENVDLYICPLENPDGTYHLNDNLIASSYSRRYNEAGIDLNRNYPYLPTRDGEANVQPETEAMIAWLTPKHFVMSVNFHCGSSVLNLPWDLWTKSTRTHADVDWYRYIGQNFVTQCHAIDSSSYSGVSGRAVLTGGDWYTCVGTRQDFLNYYLHCREITIELSPTHLLFDPSDLQYYWDINRDVMLKYILESTHGFWGTVTDAESGEPLEAQITVLGHDRFNSEVYSSLPLGAYHRPIMAGSYRVAVTAPCHVSDTISVTVMPDEGLRLDVHLQPCAPTPYAPSQYLLAGEQATLTALSTSEVYWYAADTAAEPIAVGNIFTTPPLYENTTYYVESQHRADTMLCISPRDSVMVWVIDTTTPQGIADVAELPIAVYPNPTARSCYIQTPLQHAMVRLYDMNGALLREQPLAATHTLDLSDLASGTYIIALYDTSRCVGATRVVVL